MLFPYTPSRPLCHGTVTFCLLHPPKCSRQIRAPVMIGNYYTTLGRREEEKLCTPPTRECPQMLPEPPTVSGCHSQWAWEQWCHTWGLMLRARFSCWIHTWSGRGQRWWWDAQAVAGNRYGCLTGLYNVKTLSGTLVATEIVYMILPCVEAPLPKITPQNAGLNRREIMKKLLSA